jgi:hypothetical protein
MQLPLTKRPEGDDPSKWGPNEGANWQPPAPPASAPSTEPEPEPSTELPVEEIEEVWVEPPLPTEYSDADRLVTGAAKVLTEEQRVAYQEMRQTFESESEDSYRHDLPERAALRVICLLIGIAASTSADWKSAHAPCKIHHIYTCVCFQGAVRHASGVVA